MSDQLLYNQLANNGHTTSLSAMTIYDPNIIANTTINGLSAKILHLFATGLNASKISSCNMGFLTRTSTILTKRASKWVLFRLPKLSLEPIVLVGLEQYSQVID